MKNNDLEEVKDLIEVKQSIFKRIKAFFQDIFLEKKEIDISKIPFKSFEETLLTKEEQEERKRKREKDKEEANYYKQVFENPEEFLLVDGSDEEILEGSGDVVEDIGSKEEFFKVYEDIKKGSKNVDDLSITDLLKVEALLREEISIKTGNIDPEEAKRIQKELELLEEENKILEEELKKLENQNNN